MGIRGPKSASDLATPTVADLRGDAPPGPPADLTEEQAAEWRARVERLLADWFPRETHGLLAQYRRHVTTARRLARLVETVEAAEDLNIRDYNRLLVAQERETRCIASLATRMRISQQSTYDKSKRQPDETRRPPWEFRGELSRAERNIRWIEANLRVPEGKLVGKPVRLGEFQRDFLRRIYDNPPVTGRAILSFAGRTGRPPSRPCSCCSTCAAPRLARTASCTEPPSPATRPPCCSPSRDKMVCFSPKVKSRGRIYGMVALAIAVAVATTDLQAQPPVSPSENPEFKIAMI
jgi:hypothetical protein